VHQNCSVNITLAKEKNSLVKPFEIQLFVDVGVNQLSKAVAA
jgi:hypothetical protein